MRHIIIIVIISIFIDFVLFTSFIMGNLLILFFNAVICFLLYKLIYIKIFPAQSKQVLYTMFFLILTAQTVVNIMYNLSF